MKSQTFGPWLRSLRRDAKVSLRSAADTCSLSFAYLSKVETGELPPPSSHALGRLGLLTGQSTLKMHLEAGKVPPALKSAFEHGLISEEKYCRIMQIVEGQL